MIIKKTQTLLHDGRVSEVLCLPGTQLVGAQRTLREKVAERKKKRERET